MTVQDSVEFNGRLFMEEQPVCHISFLDPMFIILVAYCSSDKLLALFGVLQGVGLHQIMYENREVRSSRTCLQGSAGLQLCEAAHELPFWMLDVTTITRTLQPVSPRALVVVLHQMFNLGCCYLHQEG